MMDALLELNPALDPAALGAQFAAEGWLQIQNVLTPRSAVEIQTILAEATPWGLAWQAGPDGPHLIRSEEFRKLPSVERSAIMAKLEAVGGDSYAFLYHSYPLVSAYLERWNPGSPHERLLEELNSPAFLDLLRHVSGVDEIVKADGQATLYAPGNFLWPHNDEEAERGRKVAYVLNMTRGDWRPQWGGYLTFYDSDWNVKRAVRPRFNSLSLFAVPAWHSVTEVTATAPVGRFAVTGWGRSQPAAE